LRSKEIVLHSVIAVLVVAGLLPVLYMLLGSIVAGGRLDFTGYRLLFTSGREFVLLRNSFTLSLLTAFFALLFGVPAGMLLARTDIPFRGVFTVCLAFPFLIPPYIMAFSWFLVLGKEGFLARLFHVHAPWLFGRCGCVLVLSTVFMPVVMLLTMIFAKTVNPRFEEAARLHTGWPGVLMRITLPMILPGISLAAVLVFLLSMGEFSVPMFLRYDVFPVESFIRFSAFSDERAGTAAAIPLLGAAFVLLFLERMFLENRTYRLQTAAGSGCSPVVELGRYRRPAALLLGVFCGVTVLAPLSAMVVESASVACYSEAFRKAGDSIVRSLLYASLGAAVLTVVGFFLGYIVHTRAVRFWRSVDFLTVFLFALPGTVTGLGLIGLWNRPATNFIYGTFLIIILGYVARYSAVAGRIMASAFVQIPASMEEAAQLAGAGWPRRMVSIIAPLSRRGLAGCWLVSFVFCLRDTGISMMVYPPGHDTVTVRTFTLMANSQVELIAALSVMVTGTVAVLCSAWYLLNSRRHAVGQG